MKKKCICKICKSEASLAIETLVLRKYPATLFKCQTCGYLMYEEPTWLAESYSRAIATCDTGRIARAELNRMRLAALLSSFGKPEEQYIDWGGGDGLFSRMMRDLGFNFHPMDKYAVNEYCAGLEPDFTKLTRVVTAFEVVEHLIDPYAEIEATLKSLHSDVFIFSTLLLPVPIPKTDWWYYSFETGQHISFFETRTLNTLAKQLGFRYTQLMPDLHLFHKNPLKLKTRLLSASRYFSRIYYLKNFLKFRQNSLIWRDHIKLKSALGD